MTIDQLPPGLSEEFYNAPYWIVKYHDKNGRRKKRRYIHLASALRLYAKYARGEIESSPKGGYVTDKRILHTRLVKSGVETKLKGVGLRFLAKELKLPPLAQPLSDETRLILWTKIHEYRSQRE